ncbi:MAG: murein biosynthesis integral membrane protein MurJ [Bacteroidetes bacterium SB0662_bin_6]|nr:murein biosynthesis integral membrane protein MurJ [Bacteroidetes bacterium SB0668_bin_1]MYE04434.1 murein biosynthesis integral membrane protein MurJ [Bacteroidetes bacterium SB0662_bin_6]
MSDIPFEPAESPEPEVRAVRNGDDDTSPPGNAAGVVGAGILTSRLMGFVRERVVAHFFGLGAHADVFQVAFRGPNLLQNLLGEGTISAAFIPIYSKMIEEGREREAGRFAGAVFGLLLALTAALSLVGILLAEPIVTIFAVGFRDDAAAVAAGELPINRFELAVQAVRIIFPMTGLLVLAAWCLGILNSHRRFFLPYFAPVLWNAAIIGALIVGARMVLAPAAGLQAGARTDLLFAAFYGAFLGGFLQFAVQAPLVFRMLRGFRLAFSAKIAGVREAIRAFGPAVAGRGVYQLSSYLDLLLASLLAAGAVSSLRPAQMLYILPISLFGMSLAASELPELSRFGLEKTEAFMQRLGRSINQMLFLTVPTCIGYLAFGLLIVGALFRTGEFGSEDSWLVYLVLAGYSLGLLATAMSRLLQNAFYARKNTRTPARIAVVRVVVSTVVAIPAMFLLDGIAVGDVAGFVAEGRTLYLGSLGLAIGATTGAWIELWRLQRSMGAMIPAFRLPWAGVRRMTATALAAAAPAGVVWWLLPGMHIAVEALIVVSVYATGYLGASFLRRAPEMDPLIGQFVKRGKEDG